MGWSEKTRQVCAIVGGLVAIVTIVAISYACARTSIENNHGNNQAEVARAEHCQITTSD